MSEKQLRELVKPLVDHWTDARFYHDQLQEALAEDPDVVKVLRWLEEGVHNLPDEPNVEQWAKAANAVASEIRRVFHVRLTETGWEWTE